MKYYLMRNLVTVLLVMLCVTSVRAQTSGSAKVDFTELGIDSTTLSRMSDSSVVQLTQMAIKHKEETSKMEYKRRTGIWSPQNDNQWALLFTIAIIPIIYLFSLLIYRIILNHSRRKQEQTQNDFLLNLVRSGQTLTPELIEMLCCKANQKKVAKLSMNGSLIKLFLGIGLIVLSITLALFINSKTFIVTFPCGLFGFFFLAQGLAGYLSIKQEGKQSENNNS